MSALGRGDREGADQHIGTIAFEPRAVEKQPSADMARIFQRDHFTFCCCGRPTIPSVVMRCFSALWPEQFLFNPHGRTCEARFAYWTIMSSLKHVESGIRGGHWTADSQHACARWNCDRTKRNAARTGNFASYAEPDPSWDGLIEAYPGLWVSAGRPNVRSHRPGLPVWLGAIPKAALCSPETDGHARLRGRGDLPRSP